MTNLKLQRKRKKETVTIRINIIYKEIHFKYKATMLLKCVYLHENGKMEMCFAVAQWIYAFSLNIVIHLI